MPGRDRTAARTRRRRPDHPRDFVHRPGEQAHRARPVEGSRVERPQRVVSCHGDDERAEVVGPDHVPRRAQPHLPSAVSRSGIERLGASVDVRDERRAKWCIWVPDPFGRERHVLLPADHELLARARHGEDGAVGQPHAAQGVVDRVGDHDVVAKARREILRHEAQAVRLAESRLVRCAVDQTALARADAPHERLAVRRELGEGVMTGVRDQEVPVRQRECLRGEPQRARRRSGRHVGPRTTVQSALRRVLGDQIGDERGDRGAVPLPRHLRHDVPLRVDDHERRPGPRCERTPGDQLRVVEDGVPHLVPLDGGGERVGISLVLELGRVHAHDDELVAVLLLDRAQLVEDVQAVDAAEGPEIQDDNLAPQLRERHAAAAGVQPAAADQLGRADTVEAR
jgi:hypothetical protein